MSRLLGIDLGTTNTVVATLDEFRPRVLPMSGSSNVLPSVVAFTSEGPVVGEAAVALSAVTPSLVVRSVKRKMGSQWSFSTGTSTFGPTEISAMIVSEAVKRSKEVLDDDDVQAVVTVPAYFDDLQRAATLAAARQSGVDVLRIVNEPTAAAMAYGVDRAELSRVVVFDLGGGTFDVSLLDVGPGEVSVVATAGDNFLGGDDWDAALVAHLLGVCSEQYSVDLSTDPSVLARLHVAAQNIKHKLSFRDRASLSWRAVCGLNVEDEVVTRDVFDSVTHDLTERCRAPFLQVFSDAQVDPASIDRVLLVGGSTRMPAVVDLVSHIVGSVTVMRGVDADEVVALGAVVLAGTLTGKVSELVLKDVTPLTLGVEADGGLMEAVVERNTPIPVVQAKTFTTAEDNQSSVLVQVFQGERPVAAMNKRLTTFELSGLPPAPRGQPQLEVEFGVDADGIVKVTVSEMPHGPSADAMVTASTVVDPHVAAAVLADAKAHAATDAETSATIVAHRVAAEAYADAEEFRSDGVPSILKFTEALEQALAGSNSVLVSLAADQLSAEVARLRALPTDDSPVVATPPALQ